MPKKQKESDQAFGIKLTGKPGDKKLEITGIPTIQIGNQQIETKDGDIHFTGDITVDGAVYSEGSDKPIEPGTYVEANPEGEASADLTKVMIGDTTYDLAGGTTVVANPTGSSSVDLTKLQVGDSIYNIPHATETLSRIYTVESISSVPVDILEAVNTGDVVSVVGGGSSTTEYRCTRKSVSKAIFEYIEGRDENAGGPGLYLYSVTYKKTSGTWSCSTFGGDVKSVEANTGETPTTDLTTLQIGNTVYGIPSSGGGGTTVVANPELVGTEPDLTSLQVGETKYKVPSEPESISLFNNATIDFSEYSYDTSKISLNYEGFVALLGAIASRVAPIVARTEAGHYDDEYEVRSATSIIPAIIQIPLKHMATVLGSSDDDDVISTSSLLNIIIGTAGYGDGREAIIEGHCTVLGKLGYWIRAVSTLVSGGDIENTYYNMGSPSIYSSFSDEEISLFPQDVNQAFQYGDIAFLDEIICIRYDSYRGKYVKDHVNMGENIKNLIFSAFEVTMSNQLLGSGT